MKEIAVGLVVVIGAIGALVGYVIVAANVLLSLGVGPEGDDHWGVAAMSVFVLPVIGLIAYAVGSSITESSGWRKMERAVKERVREIGS